MRGWLKTLALVAAAWLAQVRLADWLILHDAVALLLVQRSPLVVLLVVLLLLARFFLMFVAPAWALWRIVSWAERRITGRFAQSNSTVPDKIG
jgi:hypothetical protein